MALPPPSRKGSRGRRMVVGSIPPVSPEYTPDEIDLCDAPGADQETVEEVPLFAPDTTQLTGVEQAELQGVLYELYARENESLRIFAPMPEQERFFASDSGERIALGGNRGGKTTVTVVEIARALTGQDPYDKYPKTGGKCILVGIDLTHCSKVFYEKLFKPGAFKVIRDLETGKLRGFRPDDPADAARSHEAKKAPPLIPKRYYNYNKIAWGDKKKEEPASIPLKNGWTVYFFTSKGQPPQGWNVHLVAFDEEIDHPQWYPEMAARLLDDRVIDPDSGKIRGGKFIWSATPQAGTQALYELKLRADKLKEDHDERLLDHKTMIESGEIPPETAAPIASPAIQCFEYGMLDNPWVSTASKDEFIEKFANNEDELAVRVHGKFALLGTRVYTDFAPKGVHGIDSAEAFPNGIPEDWTCYAIIDPGRQVCAVLFVAVPPRHDQLWGGKLIVYDELYIKRCNAAIFAKTFVKKVNGRPIQAGVIDHQAGRIGEIGSGKTVEQQYSLALKAERFMFENGGNQFHWSSNDVKGGIQAVQNLLNIVDGRPGVYFFRDKLRWLCWEMGIYSYRKLPSGIVTDDPVKLNDHLCDCVRYMAMANLRYHKPRKRKDADGYVHAYLTAKKERQKAREQKENRGYGDSFKVG